MSGNTWVDGGNSGKWTDVIEIDIGGGPASSVAHGGWTLEIDGKLVTNTSEHGSIDIGDGKHAVIRTDDGVIDLDNIDKVQW